MTDPSPSSPNESSSQPNPAQPNWKAAARLVTLDAIRMIRHYRCALD